MISLLLARAHDGKVIVLEGPGDAATVNDKFKELVNAGRAHGEYSGLSLQELDFFAGRKVASFSKPLSDDQKKANQAVADRTRGAILRDEALRIQRENDDATKKIAEQKRRIKPLSAEQKRALADAPVATAPAAKAAVAAPAAAAAQDSSPPPFSASPTPTLPPLS